MQAAHATSISCGRILKSVLLPRWLTGVCTTSALPSLEKKRRVHKGRKYKSDRKRKRWTEGGKQNAYIIFSSSVYTLTMFTERWGERWRELSRPDPVPFPLVWARLPGQTEGIQKIKSNIPIEQTFSWYRHGHRKQKTKQNPTQKNTGQADHLTFFSGWILKDHL